MPGTKFRHPSGTWVDPCAQQPTRNMIGRTISHYRIVEKLGEGGMGGIGATTLRPRRRRRMSRVESIESQIQELSAEELVALREWFAEYDAGVWDRQFEDDVHAGKLDALAERALRDHRAGRSTKL